MRFRPEHDPRPGGPVEWVDNPVSNTLAWASYRIIPGWCQTEEHWTSKLTQVLWTDCPCCLLFRGVTFGILITLAITVPVIAVLIIQ